MTVRVTSKVLKEISELFVGIIGKQHLFFRIGGDEFAVLLDTLPCDAHMYAESICVAIEGHKFHFEDNAYPSVAPLV